METVLFTGAGASRAIGYPLTREFLPRVRAEIASGDLFARVNGSQGKNDRTDLQDYLQALMPGFSDLPDDSLPLITDVFSLVEYSIAAGETLPVGGDGQLRRFRDLLKRVIADILARDFHTGWGKSKSDLEQKQTLDEMGKWISRKQSLGIVTTNYDIGLEYELFRQISEQNLSLTESLDLGFEWRDVNTGEVQLRPQKPTLCVYKLHGSLDLLHCPLCGFVYFNRGNVIAKRVFDDRDSAANTCHCSDTRLELHIVSPSFVRDIRDSNLLTVWRNAFELLRRAKHWIVVGYSLPPEDLAVRSLLIRAYATSPKQRPKITVVQQGDGALAAYKMLFPDCEYLATGLSAYLKNNGS